MIIKYCKKCHNHKRCKDLTKVNEEIKKIVGDNIRLSNACNSYCGPGKTNYAISIDDELYEFDTYEEMIAFLKEEYGN